MCYFVLLVEHVLWMRLCDSWHYDYLLVVMPIERNWDCEPMVEVIISSCLLELVKLGGVFLTGVVFTKIFL